jgi:Amt family ammonium transporter
MARLVTRVSAAGATPSWTFVEWCLRGKLSNLVAITGAVAGLVVITPAAGFVLPGPALAIGLVSGSACFWTATTTKRALSCDDSLDAFGVHGIGGIIGTLATGWFAFGQLSATPDAPAGTAIGGLHLLAVQTVAVLATIVWCAAASLVLLKLTDARNHGARAQGLDIVLHGEQVL